MAKIYYPTSFRVQQQSSYRPSFNILNWRLIKNDKFVHSKNHIVEGVTLTTDQTIFIPHIIIDDIHRFNKSPETKTFKHYFIGNRGGAPNVCWECWGRGKFDWIELATGIQGPIPNGQFIRDRTSMLIYEGNDNIIFGRPPLEEGETYCKVCRGTGMQLYAGSAIFKGMLGIRKKLKPIFKKT